MELIFEIFLYNITPEYDVIVPVACASSWADALVKKVYRAPPSDRFGGCILPGGIKHGLFGACCGIFTGIHCVGQKYVYGQFIVQTVIAPYGVSIKLPSCEIHMYIGYAPARGAFICYDGVDHRRCFSKDDDLKGIPERWMAVVRTIAARLSMTGDELLAKIFE